MSTNIEIRGLDKLLKKIDNLGQLEGVKAGMKAAAVHIQGKISKYPPSSDANRPGKRWYERGYGSKWTRKDGSIGGKKTSETLGKRWATSSRDRGLTQVIGNNASYAPFVQDAEKQAAFHKQRGWSTAQGVVDDETETVVKFIQDEIDKALNRD